MKEVLTKQDVLDLFAESDAHFERRLEKSREEFDKRLKETDKRLKETDKQIKETDKQIKETDKQIKETDKQIKVVNKQIGDLSGTWGKFVEELVAPNSVELFEKRGIEITTMAQRIEEKKNGKPYYQIDLLLYNETYVIVVEVKSTLKVSDVNDHLLRMEKIQKLPPRRFDLKGAILLGAVAGVIIEEDADKYAYRKGLYVLRQKGNIVEIANDESFRPREWTVD